ncbi:MAG TPA: energy transducer TonB [Candidatus Limnocylindrales bacterium]|nr:energy transducer TonB [Candidatus Limnocylindrales bacterium]
MTKPRPSPASAPPPDPHRGDASVVPAHREKPHDLNRWFRSAAVVLVILSCAAIPSRAQQAQMVALALKTAGVISKAHQKSVVVADFWSPKEKATKLGQTLADQFSAELAGLGEFQVRPRDRLRQTITQKGLSPLALRDIDIARWMAREAHAEVIVLGNLEPINDQFKLTVSIYTIPREKNLGNFDITMPAGANWQSLFEIRADGATAAGPPQAGKYGYTIPKCDFCPDPRYSDAAFRQHLQGVVVLDVIIGSDGRAHAIVVVRKLGLGLTEEAVKVMQSWRFTPAIGPNGKPAAVHLLIEMNFRLH